MPSLSPNADLKGTGRVLEYGNVKVHTCISPEDGLLTNTPIAHKRVAKGG